MTSPRAGQPAAAADLVDVAKLVTAYFTVRPDPGEAAQRVSFGTSGHRGSAFTATFNEDHIAATTQAICEYRAGQGIRGPLYLGADTHALSEPATVTALEVLAANGVHVLCDARGGYTPTPAVSRAILAHNASGSARRALLAGGRGQHHRPVRLPRRLPLRSRPGRRPGRGQGGRDPHRR
jgi:phosphoglucomutase